ncbi:DUF885 family protein [bacterium]|nr:DUF885 family protein [bacterium]
MKSILFVLSFCFLTVSLAQTDPKLKAIADHYNDDVLYMGFFLPSFADRQKYLQLMSDDLQALQALPEPLKSTPLAQNLNWHLRAQLEQEKNCQPYYWDVDPIYLLSGQFYFQGQMAYLKTQEEFEKAFAQKIDDVVSKMQNLNERLQKILADKMIPPMAALQPYEMVLDIPPAKNKLGLEAFVYSLSSLTDCSYCAQIDGQKLMDQFDLKIGPLMDSALKLYEQIKLQAVDATPLIVPSDLRVACYSSVLKGIYSDLTGDLILKKGESELLRAEKRMVEILEKLGMPFTPPLSIPAFIEQSYKTMSADAKYIVVDERGYVAIYDRLMKNVLLRLSEITSFKNSYPIYYAFSIGQGQPKSGWYNFDETKLEGTFTTSTHQSPGYLNFEVSSMFFHETIPGHHLENSMSFDAKKMSDNEFDKRKYFTAYGEGWGLYVEELMYDMNMYESLEEQFSFFEDVRLRALRMINAYHYYIDGWDDAKVYGFTNEHLFENATNAEAAAQRPKLWNAQGVSYMVGKTVIQSMKNSALQILGSGCFTAAEYHDSFLYSGGLHMDTLVSQTSRWIKNNKCYRGSLTELQIEQQLRKDILNSFVN